MQFYFQHGDDELSYDNEDMLGAVLEDLYTDEPIMSGEIRTLYKIIPSNDYTTTSSTFVNVGDVGTFHTFTKAHAVVRMKNVLGSNSNAAGKTYFKLVVQDATEVSQPEIGVLGTGIRALAIAGKFNPVASGSPKGIFLIFRRSANTAQFWQASELLVEILEYD